MTQSLTQPAVFSRCADSVEQGRRLENLSWRLWQREQLVENEKNAPAATTTQSNATSSPQNICFDGRLTDVPQLSGSVESVADDEAVEFTSVSAPLEIARPRILRQDSSSRRDRHISSDDFEKMIVSIVKDKAPLSAPTQTSFRAQQIKAPIIPLPTIQRSGSTTTESQSPSKNSDMHSDAESYPSPDMAPRTTVVRGFSPSTNPIPLSISHKPTPSGPIPEPAASPAAKPVQSKKAPTTFKLGASCSSSEQGQSLETRQLVAPKMATFQIGASSETDGSLRGAMQSARSSALQKKQASFSNNVSTRTIEAADMAIESDSEGDYVDESAIDDDDDSSDWEDSLEDSGKSSVDDKFFQRVDSKPNLKPNRRSLITLMLAQNERAKSLGNHASQSISAIPRSRAAPQGSFPEGSPNDSDESPLMMKGMRPSNLKPIHEVPRSTAQPIAVAPRQPQGQAALSPRTTRRNMLATELTESLRHHMIWERKQKSSTANAVLKRRHTSHDVANLKQYPEQACMKTNENDDAANWNQYFQRGDHDHNGYHTKGW